MARLRAFLDSESLGYDSRKYTIRQIRHRYVLWKRDGVLHLLGPRCMSSIVCLLGSLSLSDPGNPSNSFHTHPRQSDMPASNNAPHWDMVVAICQDKQRLHFPLLTSDRYWLMRAHIVRYRDCITCGRDDAGRMLSIARGCYTAIRHTSSHPELHLSFLEALLVQPTPEHVQEFTSHVAKILTRFDHLHTSLRRTLFRTVVAHAGVGGSSETKKTILQALAGHVAMSYPPAATSSQVECPNPLPDVYSLTYALERSLFEAGPSAEALFSVADDSLMRWARIVSRRVFTAAPDDDYVDDLRWSCLVLLSLVQTRSADWTGMSVELSSDPIRRAAVMEWQMVCIVAAVENLLGGKRSSPDDVIPMNVVQGLCGVIRKLWSDWTAIPPAIAPPRPSYVSRLICASFLKLAGRLEDRVLFDACRGYCEATELWAIDESAPNTTIGLHVLAVEQLYAALRCGTFFERALVDLVVCTTDMGILTSAVDTAAVRYASADPEHAQEFLSWARHRGIAPSGEAIACVGCALARHGIASYLDLYIHHPSLSAEERVRVAVAYLRMFNAHGHRFLHPMAAADLAARATSLATQVTNPGHLLRFLQSTLLRLIREGWAARAVAITEDIATRYPATIPAPIYSRLLFALLRHREFKLAQRMLTHCAPLYPHMASTWKTIVTLRTMQGGANRVACKSASKTGQTLRTMAVASRRAYRGNPKGVSSSRLLALYTATSDPTTALYTLQILLRARRFQAANELYMRIGQKETAEVRTTAGNMILDGVTNRTSRGQRSRAFVHTFKTFTGKHAFEPNRITVNIMLKVLLSEIGLGASQARALFDDVIRMGYPTGAVPQGMEGVVPKTRLAPLSSPLLVGDVEIPQLTSPITYTRHVRPLYKMFVKTFYALGDVQAARKVIGIMKVLEAQNTRRVVNGQDWTVSL
ncbi:hypothetical protein BC628DRAFT_1308336 [Trametes gibbosa]|nr:hypothetical protein BC628DRAFT_1308336 [Trametes gibbosa]